MGEIKNRRRQKRRIAALKKSVLVLVVLLLGLILIQCGTAGKKNNTDSKQPENTQQVGQAETEMTEESQQAENTEETQVAEPEIADFSMFFTGDVMVQRCTDLYESEGINRIISEYIEQEMISADMTVINNEFPFSTEEHSIRTNSLLSV
jgi:cytoskeletal protein RodZ